MTSSALRQKLFKIQLNFKLTYLFLALNSVMFLLCLILQLFSAQNVVLVILGAQSRTLVLSGEWWRLITAAFLHVNFVHFFFNMYALVNVGLIVERFFGVKKFLLTYVLGMIGAGGLSFIVSTVIALVTHNYQDSISVGASGAIFALLGLLLGTFLWKKPYNLELPLDKFQLGLIIAMNLAFGFLIAGIDNAGHFGGFLTGIILAAFLDPEPNFRNSALRKKIVKIGAIVCIILLVVAFLAQLIWFVSNLIIR